MCDLSCLKLFLSGFQVTSSPTKKIHSCLFEKLKSLGVWSKFEVNRIYGCWAMVICFTNEYFKKKIVKEILGEKIKKSIYKRLDHQILKKIRETLQIN